MPVALITGSAGLVGSQAALHFANLGLDVVGIDNDWAAREPFTDFDVNAGGTLNVLEATRLHAPDAVFIFTSTNKVYGDTPNRLPLVEQATRWEIAPDHTDLGGIREDRAEPFRCRAGVPVAAGR